METAVETTEPRAPIASTLTEVARHAGVSPATVSRILNGTARVGAKKRIAVEEAIKLLQFEPNLYARSLKTGLTKTVGVLTQSLQGPYYAHALKGIEDGFESSSHASLIVSGQWDAATEARSLRLLMSRRVDSLIIFAGAMQDRDLLQTVKNVPTVIIGRELKAPNICCIPLDQKLGGYLATRHLLELGHTRIAFISGVTNRPDANARYAGFLEALAERAVLPMDDLYVAGDFTAMGGLNAMNELLDRKVAFTAVFGANDETASGARLALYRRGVHVPQDISVIGFDDLPSSVYMTPPLTTVRQPSYEVGHCAAHILLRMLGYPYQEIAVPPLKLVIRETTRPLEAFALTAASEL